MMSETESSCGLNEVADFMRGIIIQFEVDSS